MEQRELTVEQYADQTIEAYGLADPENDPEFDEAGRIAFIADELVGYVARVAGAQRTSINREACERTARERLEAARAAR